MHFVDINAVILKKQKYLIKCVCTYRKNNLNGDFFSNFLKVSKFVFHRPTNGRGYFCGKLISTRNVF